MTSVWRFPSFPDSSPRKSLFTQTIAFPYTWLSGMVSDTWSPGHCGAALLAEVLWPVALARSCWHADCLLGHPRPSRCSEESSGME